jgi:anti-anti-sigma regulatory factor
VIVDASTRARQAERRLILVRGPSQVDRALALCDATGVLDIVDLDPPEPPARALRQFTRTDDAA